MNEKIKKMLQDELVSEFQDLNKLELGSKEHASAVEDLEKLYRMVIDEVKIEEECKLKVREISVKEKQFELDKMAKEKDEEKNKIDSKGQTLDRYIKLGLAVAELILPLAFYNCWMNNGFRFEKTGTFTSTTFRGLFSHFRPTKK